ncbi:NAD-dependent epimerase/dehydratase family protein [uncultured Sulfitobacter sp.]|uniref:NAD-dependent epimerase/dehydratase family protein n=1 Tax=uncultured Sulfitobacter sp. TaxID=191468 RepID=UPI0026111687|nr:NAD-dependent epimerase/dehydratase family protein [uncultured Sulfitobacter sp.]
MTGTVLILGATGRFGRAATNAFANAGWQVIAASRAGGGAVPRGVKTIACDPTDKAAVVAAAQGMDVIVHTVNPPYHHWAKLMPNLTRNIIAAGLSSGATVMIPGNIYGYGEDASIILREEAARAPTTRKGALRVTMERAFEDAAAEGLRTIILRSGDYMERRNTGSWFESYIAKKASKGVFTYPGRMDAVHAWAYLPDVGRAMQQLARIRADLPAFTALGFEGYSLTGAELKAAVALAVGQPLKTAKMPWRLMRVLGLINPVVREVMEMRYLWNTPHRVDGTALRKLLPDYKDTPLSVAMQDAVPDLIPPRVDVQAYPA